MLLSANEVTVTSLHPPRLCRLAVFSIKPTLLLHKYTLILSLPIDPQQQQTHTAAAAEAGYEVDVAKAGGNDSNFTIIQLSLSSPAHDRSAIESHMRVQ